MNELHLFAGCGGGILGGILLGHTCVCAVEIDPYCRKVLLQRQRDGILPKFPIWDDVRTFDGRPWRGRVDVVAGGFPCQDISAAGKGAGIEGEKSHLWRDMARVVREVAPRYVLVENSPMLVARGLGVVLGELAELGYDAKWGVLGAYDVNADHKRERIWVLANNNGDLRFEDQASRFSFRFHEKKKRGDRAQRGSLIERMVSIFPREEDHAEISRELHGVPNWMDRIKSVGNAQFPAVVKLAWETLSQ